MAALLAGVVMSGCSRPAPPLKLGFIGGLSGRVADLGDAGRNGALLAVEQFNAAAGAKGPAVELVMADDAQDPAQARQALAQLQQAGVQALIGPMTSAMGEALLPAINAARLVTVSPTITATSMSGLDDYLFKVAPAVDENCQRVAAHLYGLGLRRVAMAYDLSNKAYTEDWVGHFGRHFEALGGQVVARQSFQAGQGYAGVMEQLLAGQPDLLMFAASAVDTVRLAQAARNLGATQALSAATWAATENLVQLGGRTVEGMRLTQYFDREDRSPAYLAFAAAFRRRFQQEPGFASVAAYDAAQALLAQLARVQDGPALKSALLQAGPFAGLQGPWRFDAQGDAQRSTHITEVRDGRFVRLP